MLPRDSDSHYVITIFCGVRIRSEESVAWIDLLQYCTLCKKDNISHKVEGKSLVTIINYYHHVDRHIYFVSPHTKSVDNYRYI